MLKKSSDTSYALARLNSSKWLLLACTAFSAVVDAVIIVLLAIGGTDAKFFVCPALLLAFDIIFFVVSLFLTNFRFKYSVGLWVPYVIFYIIVFALGNIVTSGGAGVVLTSGAVGLWAGVHVFTAICAIITALFASRKMTNRAVAGVFAALLAAGCCFYAVFMFINGYFGQGAGTRPVVYEYNEQSGEYTAVGVLGGYGTKATVPETFNGAKVSCVSANLLTGNGLKEIYLEGEKTIVDEGDIAAVADLGERKIYADKSQVLTLRTEFYNLAKSETTGNALALANSVYPRDLDEGEGYVAFNYGAEEFGLYKSALIPMYVGDLSSFNATSYVASYPYAVHRDINSVSDLDWAYKNSGGYIVGDIVSESGSLFGGALTKSASFRFSTQKIYRVTVEGGNDEMYDVTEKHPEFCKDSGFTFRYLAEGNADNFLSGLPARKGFNLSWEYSNGSAYNTVTSLKTVLDNLTASDLTVSPKWALKAPVITYARTDAENDTIEYGQDVNFSSAATVEAEGVNLEYYWLFNGSPFHICDTQSFKLGSDELAGGKPAVTQAGDYVLTVTATGGATSLSATAEATVHLAINRKPVRFEWQVVDSEGLPLSGDLVYDGTVKTVVATFDDSQWVNGVKYPFTVSPMWVIGDSDRYSIMHADSYLFMVEMSDLSSSKYDYFETSAYSVTINKATVTADWSGYENLTYSGNNYCPTATCTGFGSDGEIILRVDGAAKTAGEHTATAVLNNVNNSNYTLTNPTRTFVIDKAPLTVTASPVYVTYGDTFDGNGYGCKGMVGGDSADDAVSGKPVYSFKYKDADDTAYPDGVEVSGLTSSNYEITYVAGSLHIGRKLIPVYWRGNTDLVYNGEAKNVTALLDGVVDGDDVSVVVTGGDEINAGEYTATATLTGAAADNYRTVKSSITYTIAKAKITITAQDKTSVEGQPLEKLTATVEGTIYNEEVTYTLEKEEGETAGDYAITVVFTATDNYEVETVDATYTITAAPEPETPEEGGEEKNV